MAVRPLLFPFSPSLSLWFFHSLSHGVDGFRNVAIFHPAMVTSFLSALFKLTMFCLSFECTQAQSQLRLFGPCVLLVMCQCTACGNTCNPIPQLLQVWYLQISLSDTSPPPLPLSLSLYLSIPYTSHEAITMYALHLSWTHYWPQLS